MPHLSQMQAIWRTLRVVCALAIMLPVVTDSAPIVGQPPNYRSQDSQGIEEDGGTRRKPDLDWFGIATNQEQMDILDDGELLNSNNQDNDATMTEEKTALLPASDDASSTSSRKLSSLIHDLSSPSSTSSSSRYFHSGRLSLLGSQQLGRAGQQLSPPREPHGQARMNQLLRSQKRARSGQQQQLYDELGGKRAGDRRCLYHAVNCW